VCKNFSTSRLLTAIAPVIHGIRNAFGERRKRLTPCVQCEHLETRQLLSNISLANTTNGADSIYIRLNSSATSIQAWVNHDPASGPADQTFALLGADDTFTVDAQGGNDVLTLNLVNGNPFPSDKFTFNGGAGDDQFKILGRGTGDVLNCL